MPVELWPVMQHRMEHYREQRGKWWTGRGRRRSSTPSLLAEIARPRAVDRARPRRRRCRARKDNWGWNWSETRKALDYLFLVGDLAIAGRNSQFERALRPARAGPPAGRARRCRRPTRPRRTASWSGARPRSHGVGDRPMPARLLPDAAGRGRRPPSTTLVEAGELLPVAVEGWKRPAVPAPRRRAARAGSRPGRCSARSTRWSGSASAPSSCSTSATASRSTCPAASGCTATTCCRSCSATGSSARVDLKADRTGRQPARPGGLGRGQRARRDGRRAGRGAARARRLARPRRRRGAPARRPPSAATSRRSANVATGWPSGASAQTEADTAGETPVRVRRTVRCVECTDEDCPALCEHQH